MVENKNKKNLAVIILNWNGIKDTIPCLESVLKSTYEDFTVIVVDNASTDGSVVSLRERFPEVTVLVNETNLGCALGNNVGIEYALNKGFMYFLILNNDTDVSRDMIELMVSRAESDDSIGIVGGKICYYEDPSVIWSIGGKINFSEVIAKMIGLNKKDSEKYSHPCEVGYVTTCAMLVKRKVFSDIGFFDSEYFAGTEDVDLSYRAGLKGYKIFYEPCAKLLHKVSMSTGGGYNPAMRYFMGRGASLFMKKHAKMWQWPKFIFLALASMTVAFFRESLRGGNIKAVKGKLMGYIDGMRGVNRYMVFAKTKKR